MSLTRSWRSSGPSTARARSPPSIGPAGWPSPAAAALHVGRVSLAAIGRKLTGPSAAKQRIKRTWRFCANQRVVIAGAMRGLVRHLLKRRRAKPGKYRRQPRPLLIALDWTDVRNFHTLMAAAVMKGRAVPLLWATYTKWQLAKS